MSISKEDIKAMSRDELVKFVTDAMEAGSLDDMEIIRMAMDRIDEIDGVPKSECDKKMDEINDESFDDLPVEDQLEKLMEASNALIEEAKKMKEK